jgi:site-specific DNA recombinase
VKEVLGLDRTGRPTDRLVIDAGEAALVRRIFELYADGYSLKKICKILIDDGIPSPRARERGKYNSGIWNPTTLSGNPELGEGILNNEIYIGRRIFNRRKWVEIPNENRGFTRVPRLNPQSEWIIHEEADLRIIEQDLWERVKARQVEARAARDVQFGIDGNPLAGAKRPTHFLSGLVRCGACGQPFVSVGPRWRCKAAGRQACANSSITGEHLEARTLAGLRDRLLTPEIVSRFAVHLQRELDSEMRTAHGQREETETSLVETRRRIAKLVKQIEEDDDCPRAVMTRLKDLDRQEAELDRALATLPERTVVRLPANYEAIYRAAIAELERHLETRDAAPSRNAIRALIETVVVHAGDSRGGKVRRLELHGDLFRMLAFAETAADKGAQKRQKPQTVGSEASGRIPLVAGTRFILNLRSQMEAVLSNSIADNCDMPTLFRAAA